MNTNQYPARLNRAEAMVMLSVSSKRIFKKIVDAHPEVVHRISGEVRAKYLTSVLQGLLKPAPGVRTLGKDKRT